MPLYQLYFKNSSMPPADQDWILEGIIAQEFTLQPRQSGGGQFKNIDSDGSIYISVRTDFSAHAILAYTAADDSWNLRSLTPDQFQLDITETQVRVDCFRNDVQDSVVRPEYIAQEPRFDPV